MAPGNMAPGNMAPGSNPVPLRSSEREFDSSCSCFFLSVWNGWGAGSLSCVSGIVSFRYRNTGMIALLRYCTTDSGSFQ